MRVSLCIVIYSFFMCRAVNSANLLRLWLKKKTRRHLLHKQIKKLLVHGTSSRKLLCCMRRAATFVYLHFFEDCVTFIMWRDKYEF
jgi:hypothetical protein